MKLKGVYVANATPFSGSENFDIASYSRHLAWLADAGVAGFVPCGTTGEGAVLTNEERDAVWKTTVAFAKPKGLPVIAGCGSNDTKKSLAGIEQAARLGCDAALIVTPYYNKPTPAGVYAHYEFLSKHSPLPIVAYHVPGRTNVFMSPETIEKVMALKNVVAIKEASGSYAQWLALSTQPIFKTKALLAGDDDALAATLSLGGTGIISASANVAPRPFVKMMEAFDQGDWAKVYDIQKNLLPLVKAMFAETNPAPVKKALEILGFGDGSLRLPLVPVTAPTEALIRSALKAGEALP